MQMDTNNNNDTRTEPQCITCESSETLWRSRDYYSNCSHFEAYVAPKSSITTDAGVDYYILECRGPSLPFAGELRKENFYFLLFIFSAKNFLSDGKKIFSFGNFQWK